MVQRSIFILFLFFLAAPVLAAEIPKMNGAKEQIQHAWNLLKEMRGMKKEERIAQRLKAIDAFKKVIEYFPESEAEGARAQLEIGELYRLLKNDEEAEKHFLKVLEYPKEKRPFAEALLALARFRFKEKAYDKAISRLDQLLMECGEEKPECGEALLLWARCLWERGDLKEARGVLEKLIKEYNRSTLRVVEAYDLISQSYIQEGDLEKAQEAIEECRDALLREVSDDEERMARIRRVEKMKAIGLLEKARKEGGKEKPPGS